MKKYIVLLALILNLLPYVQNGRIKWNAMSTYAQTYINEGYVWDEGYKCVNEKEPWYWFYSPFSNCSIPEIEAPATQCTCQTHSITYTCNGGYCHLCATSTTNSTTNTNTTTTTTTGTTGTGTNITTPILPNAKQILKNASLTNTQWEQIQHMLDKIVADCLGEALYNGLKSKLNGLQLPIQFGDGSGFTVQGGIITIENGESNRLFHEMWHAYQAYQEDLSSFSSSEMNLEIESFYAQYKYLSRLPEYSKAGNKWKSMYDGSVGQALIGLDLYINNDGTINNRIYNYQMYNHYYGILEPAFRKTNEYKKEKYSTDWNRSFTSIFKNYTELATNCGE